MKVNSLISIINYLKKHNLYYNLQELKNYSPIKFDAYLNRHGNYDYFYNSSSYNSRNQIIEIDKDYNVISYTIDNSGYYYERSLPPAIIRMLFTLCVSLDEVAYINDLNLLIHEELLEETRKAIDELTNISIAKSYEEEFVHLEPVLELDESENLNFSFKIGRVNDKNYIVKNITSLVNAVKLNDEVRYGKNLAFIHKIEAFDKESQKFLKVLTLSSEHRDSSESLKKDICSTKDESTFRELINLCLNKNITLTNTKGTIFVKKIEKAPLFILDGTSISYNSMNFSIFKNEAYLIDDTYHELNVIDINKAVYSLAKILDNNKGSLYTKDFLENIYLDILPNIKKYSKVEDSFYDGIDIPEVNIDSKFLLTNNNEIAVDYDIISEDEFSPFTKKKERSYLKLLDKYGFDEYHKISDIEHIYNFLTSDLSSFNKYGKVLVDEALKRRKVLRQSQTRVNISYGINMLNLQIENDQLSEKDLARLLKEFASGNKKFFVLEDNSIMKINEEETKKLISLLNDYDIDLDKDGTNINKPSNYILKLVHQKDDFVNISKEVKAVIDEIVNYKTSDYKLESTNDLRVYQVEAFKWLKTLDKYQFGGILADEMGLGKSLEMLTFIESDDKEKPSLIVSPMSLVYNWSKEITKWTKLKYKEIVGTAEKRHEIITNIKEDERMIYLTSYDSLRQDIDFYKNRFRYIVIDEAQYIKNKFAKKTESVKALSADNRFALTGTPIENSLSDLWSIFDFVMPNYLSSYNKFKQRYETLIYEDDKETLEALVKRVTPFILRRTKKDCLKDLPDRIEVIYTSKMESEQRKLYDAYLTELKNDLKENTSKIQVLSYLTKLREICVHPSLINKDIVESSKFRMLEDLLEDLISGEHRILIFSQFVSVFPYLEDLLNHLGYKYLKLTGQTKSIDRIRYVDEFNENEEIKVFLISLKAGGTGLNLTGADTVIHLDPWWNVSSENQASDRVHRIGQTKNVTIIKMITENTIEEKVLELQKIKKDLANKIIDNDLEKTSLSKEDIEYLLD